MMSAKLFTPFERGGLHLADRIVIAPMPAQAPDLFKI
jgi:2,4-dienoyl-CoA reductase-like NADH-dependent reductase (Old Yellow Enzyme family)